MRFFTKATAFDLSMACTWMDTQSGMGRSMMSARQRSESSLPNRFMESTCPHISSVLKHAPEPSGLKSREAGQMRSLLVRPLAAPTASHENRLGLPGRKAVDCVQALLAGERSRRAPHLRERLLGIGPHAGELGHGLLDAFRPHGEREVALAG